MIRHDMRIRMTFYINNGAIINNKTAPRDRQLQKVMLVNIAILWINANHGVKNGINEKSATQQK